MRPERHAECCTTRYSKTRFAGSSADFAGLSKVELYWPEKCNRNAIDSSIHECCDHLSSRRKGFCYGNSTYPRRVEASGSTPDQRVGHDGIGVIGCWNNDRQSKLTVREEDCQRSAAGKSEAVSSSAATVSYQPRVGQVNASGWGHPGYSSRD